MVETIKKPESPLLAQGEPPRKVPDVKEMRERLEKVRKLIEEKKREYEVLSNLLEFHCRQREGRLLNHRHDPDEIAEINRQFSREFGPLARDRAKVDQKLTNLQEEEKKLRWRIQEWE